MASLQHFTMYLNPNSRETGFTAPPLCDFASGGESSGGPKVGE